MLFDNDKTRLQGVMNGESQPRSSDEKVLYDLSAWGLQLPVDAILSQATFEESNAGNTASQTHALTMGAKHMPSATGAKHMPSATRARPMLNLTI